MERVSRWRGGERVINTLTESEAMLELLLPHRDTDEEAGEFVSSVIQSDSPSLPCDLCLPPPLAIDLVVKVEELSSRVTVKTRSLGEPGHTFWKPAD